MLQNLHTHTTYCDGKFSATEMIESAISKGLKSVGFSGHSPIPIKNGYCMTYENLPQYIAEINELKQKYEKKCEIFLGLETEQLYPIDLSPYDYTISSVHAIIKDDEVLEVDFQKANIIDDVTRRYDGDFYAYITEYYRLVVEASKYGDILGHFDLVTKYNILNDLFDEKSNKYLDIANSALEKCIKNGIIFEINTGAISRGYTNRFYPAPYLLHLLKENNAKIIITSDAHHADSIDCFYNESVKILKDYGFKKQMFLTKNGFDEVNL
ncbi:MAG: histidinol-phosphatase [Clostridia bacterium]